MRFLNWSAGSKKNQIGPIVDKLTEAIDRLIPFLEPSIVDGLREDVTEINCTKLSCKHNGKNSRGMTVCKRSSIRLFGVEGKQKTNMIICSGYEQK